MDFAHSCWSDAGRQKQIHGVFNVDFLQAVELFQINLEDHIFSSVIRNRIEQVGEQALQRIHHEANEKIEKKIA